MIYIIDIDGTICTKQKSGNYHLAEPIKNRIEKINSLFDNGHIIIYWTARGMATKVDYSILTEQQLKKWNCKYTELRMNKPSYDVWVDDKANWIFDK